MTGNMGDLNFNAAEVEPGSGFDPLPAGEYDVAIVASERKPNSKGTGSYLKLELQVLTGQFQNRKLWQNLNIDNPSEEARKIARGELSAICRAVNVMNPKDSAELHNKPFKVKVTIRPAKGDYDASNRVTPIDTKRTAASPASTAPVASQPGSVGAPWPGAKVG